MSGDIAVHDDANSSGVSDMSADMAGHDDATSVEFRIFVLSGLAN